MKKKWKRMLCIPDNPTLLEKLIFGIYILTMTGALFYIYVSLIAEEGWIKGSAGFFCMIILTYCIWSLSDDYEQIKKSIEEEEVRYSEEETSF